MTMAAQAEKEKTPLFQALETVLAYFTANKNYAYVDVLANALDPLTAKETLINAVRDFLSACDPTAPKEPKPGEVPCPPVDPRALERDLGVFLRMVENQDDPDRFFQVTRSLALRALARAARLRFSLREEEPESV